MRNKEWNTRLAYGTMIFAAVCVLLSLVRWAGAYAVQTSRLRQLDGVLQPALTVVCIVLIGAILLVSQWKKTSGRYACFGFFLWGSSLLLYGLITPHRIMKMMYAPAIQALVIRTGLAVDVTTIQAVKTAAEALNMLACALSVILGAAAILALVRRMQRNAGLSGAVFPCLLACVLGIAACYTVLPALAAHAGYSILFCLLAVLLAAVSLAAWLLLRHQNVQKQPVSSTSK